MIAAALFRTKHVGALMLAFALLVGSACTDITGESSDDPWPVPTEPGVHELPDGPLSPREHSLVAAVDNWLVVFGGLSETGASTSATAYNDGAVFDIESGTWSKMAASPFSPSLQRGMAVRSGDEVLFAGMQCRTDVPPPTEQDPDCSAGPAAATYRPSTDVWTMISVPDVSELSNDGYFSGALGNGGDAGGQDGATLLRRFDDPATLSFDARGQTWESIELPGFSNTYDLSCVSHNNAGDVVRNISGTAIPRGTADGLQEATEAFTITDVTSLTAGHSRVPGPIAIDEPIVVNPSTQFFWEPKCLPGGIVLETSTWADRINIETQTPSWLYVDADTGKTTKFGPPAGIQLLAETQAPEVFGNWLVGIDDGDWSKGWAWSAPTGWISFEGPISDHDRRFDGVMANDGNVYSSTEVLVLPSELR